MNFRICFIVLLTIVSIKISFVCSNKYGNKTFDQWTWLTAHNAHINWDDSRILEAFTNQYYSVERQLDYGVRGFMFDIDWKDCSGLEAFFGSCRCTGICLCHGPCTDMVKDGFDIKKFSYFLNILVRFLTYNRDEIITIFLEDYIDDVKILQKEFKKVKGFEELVFDPYSSMWNVTEFGWPRIVDMIDSNKRILIVDDEKRGFHAKKWPGFIRSRDFFIENHFEWMSRLNKWDNFNKTQLLGEYQYLIALNNTVSVDMSPCFSLHKNDDGPLWSEDKTLNLTIREHKYQIINGKKLFLFNHFFGIKALHESMNPITKMIMNKKEFISKRLEEKCYPGANFKKPNFIALDFIDPTTHKEVIEQFNL